MIGVGKGIVNNLPSLLLIEVLFVDQNSQKLDNSQSWMSVVQLNAGFFREVLPNELAAGFFCMGFMSPQDILNGS